MEQKLSSLQVSLWLKEKIYGEIYIQPKPPIEKTSSEEIKLST